MPVQTTIIEQAPLYRILPVGQEIIFVVSNDDAVANQLQVKFIAEVHIGAGAINLSSSADIIGTFKTTPNNAGVGIFDLSNVIENYVKSDNMAATGSKYKLTTTSDNDRHPIHLIDQFSQSGNVARFMAIQFKVEYQGATTCAGVQDPNVVATQCQTAENSVEYTLFNGYVKDTDNIRRGVAPFPANFGFDMNEFEPVVTFPTANTIKFLTNSPTTVDANLEDYGTFGIYQFDNASNVHEIRIMYYGSDDSALGNETITKDTSTGAFNTWSVDAEKQVIYLGAFPGNLQNSSTTFKALVTANTIQGGYYTINARNNASLPSTASYRINVKCPDLRGYASIRLCWINQWGVWDYYTFTKKSTRTLNTSRTTYTQLAGTWNERLYRTDSYKGGKKAFRNNGLEKIIINTDFVSEEFNTMFEELSNSPEVYMLQGYQDDTPFSNLSTYVTPVRLTSNSFTYKTVANDKLIQYAFEIEKSKTLKTQSV